MDGHSTIAQHGFNTRGGYGQHLYAVRIRVCNRIGEIVKHTKFHTTGSSVSTLRYPFFIFFPPYPSGRPGTGSNVLPGISLYSTYAYTLGCCSPYGSILKTYLDIRDDGFQSTAPIDKSRITINEAILVQTNECFLYS